jgi:multisubunit Na+/H+ antiporter MnhB subunit
MKGMSVIVKTVARWVKVFILLYGIYITITGHLTPGGGFAGGVIIACLYILLTLAYGKEAALKSFPRALASSLDSLGAIIFMTVALLGIWFGGFFINFIWRFLPSDVTESLFFNLLSSGTIPINNIAIGIKVSASLFLCFMILSVLRIEDADDKTKKFIQDEEEE